MSQVVVEIGAAMTRTSQGQAPIFAAKGYQVEEETATGTAAATTIATQNPGDVIVILNNGPTAVWAEIGGTAAVGTGHFILPGSAREFGGAAVGDTVSVILDS